MELIFIIKEGGRIVNGFAVKQIADTNGAGDSFWGGFLYKVSTSEKHLDELTQENLKDICPFRQCSGQSLRGEKRCNPGYAGACQVERRIAE